jgi:hypothetical protein
MEFLKKNKILTGVVVLALAGVLYFAFFSSSATPSLSSSDVNPVSQDLLVTLANLHTIRLDGSIFSNPAFVSLTDFGVIIPSQDRGRRNPFAPVGANVQKSPSSVKPIPVQNAH